MDVRFGGARAPGARAQLRLLAGAALAGHALAAGALGCASANTGAAGQLATQGAAVARTSETALAAARPGLERYIEGLYLAAPLDHRNPPTAATLDAVGRVADAMDARAQVMAQLAGGYDSFAALATYGDPDSGAAGLGALTAAVNTYATTLGRPTDAVPDGAGRALGAAGRQVAGRVQGRRLQASSRALHAHVVRVRDLLRAEAGNYDEIAQAVIARRCANAEALYALHLLTPAGLLGDQVDDYGLAVDSARVTQFPDAAAPGQRAALDSAVVQVLRRRVQRRVEAEQALLRATIGGLDALADAHLAFERGAPLPPARVAAQLALMTQAINGRLAGLQDLAAAPALLTKAVQAAAKVAGVAAAL